MNLAACLAVCAMLASLPPVDPSARAEPASFCAMQDTKPGGCKKCDNTGRLACPEHPRAECELELDLQLTYCSVLVDCPACGGTGFVMCTECKNQEAAAALTARRAQLAERRVALKPIDDTMGRALRKAESPHFVLVWEIDRLKVNKKHLLAHELLHVYLKRLERVFADYCATFGIADTEFAEKPWIFVWELPQEQFDASTRFCGLGSHGPVKLLGRKPRFSVLGTKIYFQDDEKLHRNLVHSVVHLLLSEQPPSEWIGNLKGGWADEGLSHWFEEKYWGICDNYCYQEADTNADFKSGKFKLAIRKLVSMDTTPPISEVLQQNSDTLTLPMHATAFSYVDFLMKRDASKLNLLLKKMRERVSSRDALQQVFGMSPLDMEAQWKAWVLATYPTR